MEANEARYEALKRPQSAKLKSLGKGVRIDLVAGTRVLVKTVNPFTQIDEVEQKGLLVVPESVKAANRPLPSVGVVVQLGQTLLEEGCDINRALHNGEWRRIIDVGTAVMFSRFAGSDVTIEQEDFRIMDFKEIMCTLVLTDPVGVEDPNVG